MKWLTSIRVFWRSILVVLTPILLLPLPLVISTQEAKCAYGLLLMAVYWTTEALPLTVTALLPVLIFPLMGVMGSKELCRNYITDINMLFIGGIILAVAIEDCNLHKRIALKVLRLMGAKPRWLLLGFMFPTWFLSMWASNTATAAMMMTITQAVIEQLDRSRNDENIESPPNPTGAPQEIPNCKAANRTMAGKENGNCNGLDAHRSQENYEGHNSTDQQGSTMGASMRTEQETNLGPLPVVLTDEATDTSFRSSFQLMSDPDVQTVERKEEIFRKTCKCFCLAIAYAANIGGTATITGGGANLVFRSLTDNIFKRHGMESPINFTSWSIFAAPVSAMCIVIAWIWLQLLFLPKGCRSSDPEMEARVKEVIRKEHEGLGKMSFAEKVVLVHFILLALLWLFRNPDFMPGWSDILPSEGFVSDATPAVLIAISLFIFPSKKPHILCWTPRSGRPTNQKSILDWATVEKKFPWGLIVLIGGSLALADACQKSGLSKWIGAQLTVLYGLPPWALQLIVTILIAGLTEFTSNTATATIILPILGEMAENIRVNPLYLMLPAAVAASFAFMLPIATPPNAIVFTHGHLRVIDMAKTGILLNILCSLVVVLAGQTWGLAYFQLDKLPWEANNSTTPT